jgi:hypothetical protein
MRTISGRRRILRGNKARSIENSVRPGERINNLKTIKNRSNNSIFASILKNL